MEIPTLAPILTIILPLIIGFLLSVGFGIAIVAHFELRHILKKLKAGEK